MPNYLCIALGNATKEALQENAQGVFIKAISAANPNAAITQFADEQDTEGRYVAIPTNSLVSAVASRQSSLNVVTDP